MIKGWRAAFDSPSLPFFYVELCTEYGAEEPKEHDFWLAQRAAVALPNVGFAVTTDIQRALHPPDKQDVASRLALEIRRIVYGDDVVSRGPELLSTTQKGASVVFRFSNSSLTSHAGILVGSNTTCAAAVGHDSAASDPLSASHSLDYTVQGDEVTVACTSPKGVVRINADYSTCFLYGPHGLPAPPIEASCSQ